MGINRNNYEVFAVDFIDGTLSPAEAAEFLAFLAENPDIANEIELLRESSAKIDPGLVKADFSFLMKDLNQLPLRPENYDEMCIAFHEGDLNEEASNKLLNEIKTNNTLKAKFEQYSKLKLVPDNRIVFTNKSSLLHREIPVPVMRRIVIGVSAAAAAFIGFMLFNTSQADFSAINQLDNVVSVLQIPTAPILEETSEINDNIEGTKPAERKKKVRKTVLPLVEDNVEFAKIDTTEPEEERFIRITRIETPQLETKDYLAESTIVLPDNFTGSSAQNEDIITDIRKRGNQLFAQAGKITFTDVIQTGIKGINQLAETDLKYETITDEDGKVVEFALSSENFNIRRKSRRN